METASPPAAAAAPPRARPRGRALRLAGVLLLGAAALAAAWYSSGRGRGQGREPSGVFDYVRDRALAGDGGALWRVMSPRCREDYVRFLAAVAAAPDSDRQAGSWRTLVGISRGEVAALPPEEVCARELLCPATISLYRGARVYRTDMWGEDEALLYVSTGTGGEKVLTVVRQEGAWKVDNLLPLVTSNAVYIRKGDPSRTVTPVDQRVRPPSDK